MKELTFEVSKQEDGWYLASATYGKGSGMVTEAEDYTSLKEKIREAIDSHFSDGYAEKVGLSPNPKIRLKLQEELRNGGKESILIAGNPEGIGYRALCNENLNLSLYHQDLDELKSLILQEAKKQKIEKGINFVLEEVLTF